MPTNETSWQAYLPRACDDEPLRNPREIIAYLSDAIGESWLDETVWLIAMSPGRRPLSRIELSRGPIAAVPIVVRDVFQIALQARAYSMALVRTTPTNELKLTGTDLRLAERIWVAAKALDVEFVDYLTITSAPDLASGRYGSWRKLRAG
jgi:DNA repair protein RadC